MIGVLDSVFVGLTIYVAAMFKDLQDTIRNMEVDLYKSNIIKNIKLCIVILGIFRLDITESKVMPFHRQKQLKEFRKRLVQCIVYHNKTLWLVISETIHKNLKIKNVLVRNSANKFGSAFIIDNRCPLLSL